LAVGCDFIINHPSINKNGNSINFFSEYITLFNGKIDVQLAAITFLFIIWSLPGVFVYFLGQYFEYRFATDKKEDSLLG
ncbi:MAG: hypothetical protein KIG68_03700, partial [Oxalobacter sp.]|nr:hypothetical protein [Oxalobacter sp.]